MERKKNFARNLALFFTVISLIFTLILIYDIIPSYIRLREKGIKMNMKVVDITFNRSVNPPLQFYKMEFIDKEGAKRTRVYTNNTSNISRFQIGQLVPMIIIDDNRYDDFWYPPDLKTHFWMPVIITCVLYLITFICWYSRKSIQKI